MNKTMGTLRDLGWQVADSFRRLTPAQLKQTRKVIYEKVTGKPFREKRSNLTQVVIKRRNRKSEVLLHMDGNATYQELRVVDRFLCDEELPTR